MIHPLQSAREAVEKALEHWIALEWQEFKGGEPVNLYRLGEARIAVRDAFLDYRHLRASRQSRRKGGAHA